MRGEGSPGGPQSRKDLADYQRTPLKKSRSWATPDVFLLERDGNRYVMKDCSGRPFLLRVLWNRFVIARETTAHERLADIEAVPNLISRLDADGFVMAWMNGNSLPRRRNRDQLGARFFEKLRQLLDDMHAHGVAHGDLRRRNILVSPDGSPFIIDFETAVLAGPGRFRTMAFNMARNIDRITVLKIQHRYYPETTSEAELQVLTTAPWYLRLGRFVRQKLYGPISPKHLKPRLKRWRRALLGR